MRTIFVDDLGWDAALVTIAGQRVLLMDNDLSWDQRMNFMFDAMARCAD